LDLHRILSFAFLLFISDIKSIIIYLGEHCSGI